ncbi:MAG: enoyl-CoA hydratase/isomerase family protein [Thermoproteus sp.]|jgi:enoyl-CoA hydratase/carnithine racemase
MSVTFNKVMIWNEENIGVVAINNGNENYLDQDTIIQLTAALTIANNDDNVKWIAVTGTGSTFFTAGVPWESVKPTYPSIYDLVKSAKALFSVVATSSKPVIAVLNGSALGLGLDLALLSDLAIAPPDVYLCYPEGRVGIPMPIGHRAVLNRLPRYAAIKLLTGEPMDARDAAGHGLVHLVERGNLFGDAKNVIKGLRIGGYLREELAGWIRDAIDELDSAFLRSLLEVMADEGGLGELLKVVRSMRVRCQSRYRA